MVSATVLFLVKQRPSTSLPESNRGHFRGPWPITQTRTNWYQSHWKKYLFTSLANTQNSLGLSYFLAWVDGVTNPPPLPGLEVGHWFWWLAYFERRKWPPPGWGEQCLLHYWAGTDGQRIDSFSEANTFFQFFSTMWAGDTSLYCFVDNHYYSLTVWGEVGFDWKARRRPLLGGCVHEVLVDYDGTEVKRFYPRAPGISNTQYILERVLTINDLLKVVASLRRSGSFFWFYAYPH